MLPRGGPVSGSFDAMSLEPTNSQEANIGKKHIGDISSGTHYLCPPQAYPLICPVTGDVPKGSVLGFIDDLGIKLTISKFVDNTKLSQRAALLEGRKALQRNLDRLDRSAESNSMRLNKTDFGHNNPQAALQAGGTGWGCWKAAQWNRTCWSFLT
ncbi:hypothetical protein BTVI_144859 [Pitangus sulphuratus]|nr:hypothetical protein BTVI_144859 [Pitangus sulphuratus]